MRKVENCRGVETLGTYDAERLLAGQRTPRICLDTAEVTGSIPVAPTGGNPCRVAGTHTQ